MHGYVTCVCASVTLTIANTFAYLHRNLEYCGNIVDRKLKYYNFCKKWLGKISLKDVVKKCI